MLKYLGVCHFTNSSDIDIKTGDDLYNDYCNKNYINEEQWFSSNSKKLKDLGFNMIGAWGKYYPCDMKYTICFNLGFSSYKKGCISDYFSVKWFNQVEEEIKNNVKPNDENLYGYFLANEMRWSNDYRSWTKSVVIEYLNFTFDQAGKQAVINYCKFCCNDDIHEFNWCVFQSFKDWDEALRYTKYIICSKDLHYKLMLLISDKFYKITSETLKKYDPNHLNLGSRLIGWCTPKAVLESCAKYCDVVSINFYITIFIMHFWLFFLTGSKCNWFGFKYWQKICKKPFYISEFGVRGKNNYNPNTNPFIFKVYSNQKKRAKRLEKFLKMINKKDYIIGFDLFKWCDQPINGRKNPPDAENNNFGLVNKDEIFYPEIVNVLKSVNKE